MTAVRCHTIGGVRLSRVPYFDVGLPPEAVGLSAATVASVPWAEPWCDGAQLRVGQAFWVIESGGRTIVVDPCGASDAFLRTGPDAVTHQDAAFAAFGAAGFDPSAVDTVVMSHLDGIGMLALVDRNGGWQPAFPNAPILMSDREWTRVLRGPTCPAPTRCTRSTRSARSTRVALPYEVTPEVRLVRSGGHTDGHLTVVVESDGARALFLGHLAVTPVSAGTGAPVELHDDPLLGDAALRRWLTDAATDDALVIGPLWPDPGAARVRDTDPVVLEPVAP